jgi:hypothetical protein
LVFGVKLFSANQYNVHSFKITRPDIQIIHSSDNVSNTN